MMELLLAVILQELRITCLPFQICLFCSIYVLTSSGIVEKREWSYEKKAWDVTSTHNDCQIYGKCGSFGSCDARESPICTCFRGYSPKAEDEWEAGNWTNGCIRETPLKCEHNSSLGKEDEFLKMEGVGLRDPYILFPVDKDCRGACLVIVLV